MAEIRNATIRYRLPDGTPVSPRASARDRSLHPVQAMPPGSSASASPSAKQSLSNGVQRQSHVLFPEAFSEPETASVRTAPKLRIVRCAAYAVGGLAVAALVVAYLAFVPVVPSGKPPAPPPAAASPNPLTP